MRVISLSVDGIFQAAQRGLYDWLANQDADVICLQDLAHSNTNWINLLSSSMAILPIFSTQVPSTTTALLYIPANNPKPRSMVWDFLRAWIWRVVICKLITNN